MTHHGNVNENHKEPHFRPTRMAKMEKINSNKYGKNVEETALLHP